MRRIEEPIVAASKLGLGADRAQAEAAVIGGCSGLCLLLGFGSADIASGLSLWLFGFGTAGVVWIATEDLRQIGRAWWQGDGGN